MGAGDIRFSEGGFNIAATISVPTGVQATLRGAGRNKTFLNGVVALGTDEFINVHYNARDFVIDGFTIDGNTYGDGLFVEGLATPNYQFRPIITNLYITDLSATADYGIRCDNAFDAVIRDTIIDSAVQHGIRCRFVQRFKIDNNYINAAVLTGIRVDHSSNQGRILDNKVSGLVAGGKGIRLIDDGATPNDGCYLVDITGNSIAMDSIGSAAIGLDRETRDCDVYENSIYFTANAYGIQVYGEDGSNQALRNKIHHNRFKGVAAVTTNYVLDVGNVNAVDTVLKDNIFDAAPRVRDSGTTTTIRNNEGYATETSGTATLVNGQTSIVVTHGLAVTPAAGDIMVTPIEAWGAMVQFYLDTYTATQFTINADQDPGQDVDFAWKAIVL